MTIFRPEALRGGGSALAGEILPIPADEALDIDTPGDLAAARLAATRKNILIEVVVGKTVGSGHFHRAVRLAEGLAHHEVGITISGEWPTWALEILDGRGLWWEGCESTFRDAADLVIIDTLDTTVDQIARWKRDGKLVVTFEDEGTGSLYADLTINELLPSPSPYRKTLVGPRYTILRPEFAVAPLRPVFRPRAERILISFGGTDPAGLNRRFSNALSGYRPLVLVGPGADPTGISGVLGKGRNMAQCMTSADLVITSQGRTQYEAAAIGVPCITIAANERESRHVRVPGSLHLGLHAAVSDGQLCEAVHRLSGAPELRAEMGETAKGAVDGRGLERVVYRIDGLLSGLA